ncbi:unnamed protein product [Vitrella brassicaformis CCMP3155]|uniref:Uncharacterized protein n=1 Tax=Vitrella brassicaformis (strain CCMP3155) TaxID=1169540 RepID=A0A0G4FB23_VITBC|nr:unnamed protein product [Vitrella brassicaformis CCMP3155]|eukprot:CEM10104.1 unnamed protein product [Vitrella brassicaformis CCMP3155]
MATSSGRLSCRLTIRRALWVAAAAARGRQGASRAGRQTDVRESCTATHDRRSVGFSTSWTTRPRRPCKPRGAIEDASYKDQLELVKDDLQAGRQLTCERLEAAHQQLQLKRQQLEQQHRTTSLTPQAHQAALALQNAPANTMPMQQQQQEDNTCGGPAVIPGESWHGLDAHPWHRLGHVKLGEINKQTDSCRALPTLTGRPHLRASVLLSRRRRAGGRTKAPHVKGKLRSSRRAYLQIDAGGSPRRGRGFVVCFSYRSWPPGDRQSIVSDTIRAPMAKDSTAAGPSRVLGHASRQTTTGWRKAAMTDGISSGVAAASRIGVC